ncbi:MAG: hypothetical protein JSV16_08585 [Candidatus Hydrogenedentota bacterium]|nr:MAG: hypothetical protein JSV16_08585 [Candidatus Hydrogenedentota bacterium]
MAKRKALPERVELSANRNKLVKALIIGGTFAAIAILSIVTRSPGNAWPSLTVVAIRIVLLSACTAVYFWMLYRTKTNRQNDKQKPQAGRK